MRVVVVGATGLVGTAVCARLAREGHEVLAAGRSGAPPGSGLPAARIDLADAGPEDWAPHLAGADAVVNCAGALQDGPADDVAAVHASGPAALFAACERASVRRVIHISAMGVDAAQPSAFSATKRAGEEALTARDLDWVILRPSVILGRGAYGASALIRALAWLPVLPSMPDAGRLTPVRLEDVAETAAFFLKPDAPARVALDLAGPNAMGFDDLVAAYRRWLGWPPARRAPLPRAAARALYRLGDWAGRLGWRPPMRETARLELPRGAAGDPARWTEVTGIVPRRFEDALAAEPATVQERWFAGLCALKPAIFVVLVWFWITTGLVSLTVGYGVGVEHMLRGGAGVLSGPGVVAGALADLVIGAAIAWRPWTRAGLWGAIGLSLFYALSGTILRPDLWADPLGPLLKIWPILALHVAALAILPER